MWDTPLSPDAIGCDRCSTWYCPRTMCLGLPANLVDAIKTYDGDGIAILCTDCHVQRSAAVPPDLQNVSTPTVEIDAFKQLHEMVKAVCKEVGSLSKHVKKVENSQVELRALSQQECCF